MQNIKALSIPELLQSHAKILSELKNREATRSTNNPTGDYAEYLFAKAFGWILEANSKAGHDAIDPLNKHSYQIKARRLTGGAGDRQLGILRNLDKRPFDSLAAILFDENYLVHRAVIMPIELAQERSMFTAHVNGYRLMLNDKLLKDPGVLDVTAILKLAEAKLSEKIEAETV